MATNKCYRNCKKKKTFSLQTICSVACGFFICFPVVVSGNLRVSSIWMPNADVSDVLTILAQNLWDSCVTAHKLGHNHTLWKLQLCGEKSPKNGRAQAVSSNALAHWHCWRLAIEFLYWRQPPEFWAPHTPYLKPWELHRSSEHSYIFSLAPDTPPKTMARHAWLFLWISGLGFFLFLGFFLGGVFFWGFLGFFFVFWVFFGVLVFFSLLGFWTCAPVRFFFWAQTGPWRLGGPLVWLRLGPRVLDEFWRISWT